MIKKLNEIWQKKGFEIILSLCISFIFIFGIYHFLTKKKGTFSRNNYYPISPAKSYKSISPVKSYQNAPKESKGEAECRRVLQNVFRKPFTSQRPDFLRNPVTGGNFNLELDCFNNELRLAVEYNGIQHYKYVPYFHRNKDHFMTQKYRDDMKRRICKENNINLIEVPYTVKHNDIASFIIQNCRKLSYKI
jgi:hypothetical protein